MTDGGYAEPNSGESKNSGEYNKPKRIARDAPIYGDLIGFFYGVLFAGIVFCFGIGIGGIAC